MRTNSLSEADLVRRAPRDMDAFGELVERYRKSIQRQCFSRVRDHEHAEDLAQEAFVRAYLKLDQLRDPELFPNWLRRIASNVCNEFLRSPSRQELAVEFLEIRSAGGVDSSDSGLRLDVLPERTRACVELYYEEGMGYSEIAGALGITPASVKGRLNRAKTLLRREMAEMAPPERSAFTQRVIDRLEKLESRSPNEREGAAREIRRNLGEDRFARILGWLKGIFPEADETWTEWHVVMNIGGAIRASKRYPSPEMRDALIDIMLNSDYEELRLQAAGALVAQKDPAAIPALEQAVEDPRNPREVVAAAKSAIAQLSRVTERPRPDTEAATLRRDLERASGDPRARVELMRRLKAALKDPEPSVREHALKALMELGDKRAVPAISELLRDPDGGIRKSAAAALGDIGSSRAVPALAEALREADDSEMLKTLISSIGKIGDRAALPAVLDAIHEKWHLWRYNGCYFVWALEFAGAVGTADDLPLIRTALDKLEAGGETAPERIGPQWVRVLASLGDGRHVPELAEALRRSPLDYVVRDVSAGLARIGGTEAAAVLGEHLLATASRDAAGALGALGEPGLRILRDALRHAQPRVRAEAARAVWESGGDQAAMPLLEELAASDPSSSVRFQAKLAVRKMRRR